MDCRWHARLSRENACLAYWRPRGSGRDLAWHFHGVVALQRGRQTIVPRSETQLMPEDEVRLYAMPKETAEAARQFVSGSQEHATS